LGAAEELLWLLPPDPAAANGDMIAAVAQAAVGLFERHHSSDSRIAAHYVGYLDLVTRALLRLKGRNATVAGTALRDSGLDRVRGKLSDRSILKRLEELRL